MEFSLNPQVVKPARAAAFDLIIEQALTSGR
jgi:hypothetical protein